MFKKFLSRRFLLTAAVCIVEALGFSVPIEVIGIIGTYVIGESVTDAACVFNPKAGGD